VNKAIEEAKGACRAAYALKVDALVEYRAALDATNSASDSRLIDAHAFWKACASGVNMAEARLRESVHDAVMAEARKMA